MIDFHRFSSARDKTYYHLKVKLLKFGSRHFYNKLLSHTRTVERVCCNGNDSS